MQASFQEGAAPFFLQGPWEDGDAAQAQQMSLVEEGPSRGHRRQCLRAVNAPSLTLPFRSHLPCVSQSGFSLSPSDEGTVLREVTELPHGPSAAPELRPLEARPMLPPPTPLNPLGKPADPEPRLLPPSGSHSAPAPQ